MRRTLFHIPHECFEVRLTVGENVVALPFGWLLIAWCIFSLGLLGWLTWRQGLNNNDTLSYLPLLVVVALAFGFLLPLMEVKNAAGTPVGLPIRGYGVMVMLGIVAGVALATYRAHQMGLEADVILSLAFWMFLAGITGARLFFVIQNWSQFAMRDENQNIDWPTTLKSIASVPQGGLVVYGAVIGGLGAALIFLNLRRLPILAIGDIIAPSMVVGLAIGRIGCFLNGCCYGGLCEPTSPLTVVAVQFPRDAAPVLHATLRPEQRENSPPYAHQRGLGLFHGIRIDRTGDDRPVLMKVDPDVVKDQHPANKTTLKPGDEIASINGEKVKTVQKAHRMLQGNGLAISVKTTDGKHVEWAIAKLPDWSFPVHPSQIYSAVNAALLALVLWFYYPLRRRDGELLAILLVIYPITRWLLEIVRDDEPGRFGTELTISQWVSGLVILSGVALWVIIWRGSKTLALPQESL